MKTFYVQMLAFSNGERRPVELSEEACNRIDEDNAEVGDRLIEDALLNAIYHYGQNDFQPRKIPSVSAGDVIEGG